MVVTIIYKITFLSPFQRLGDVMSKRMIAMAVLMLLPQLTLAARDRVLDTMLTLYQGESKVISAPNVERIAMGNTSLVSSTLLESGEIVLTADEAGETNMQVWFTNGSLESLQLVVAPKNGWRESLEIKKLLGQIPGIRISTVGRRVVVDGNLEARDLERVNMVKERYDDMLILAREITEYEQKMVYFDVRITEFDRDVTEELGINWSKQAAGPTIGYASIWQQEKGLIPENDPNDVLADLTGLNKAEGLFWGISTGFTSVIDLLEQTGVSITLAEPRLSTRSGGSASLTVGGEVPVVVSNTNGSSVEYKDYGVLLGVSPKIDMYDNITANVSVSISQLDLANAVDGQPAFKKRATENDVVLRPGETLVLSGLITQEEQLTSSNVKWLADIPVLGALFRSKSFTSGTTEMVIFMTPHIVGDVTTGVNKAELDRAEKMVKDFEEKVGYSLSE